MSSLRVEISATGSPKPTPALLTRTSRRSWRSRWAATTCLMPSSSPRSAATADHVVARGGQLGACALELLGPPGGDRQRVALLPEEVREPQPDAARGPCHDRCALRHSTPSIAAEAQYPITRRWLPCDRMRSVRHVLAPLLAASALTLAACGGNEEPAAPPLRSPSRPSPPTSRPRRARRARSSSSGLTEGPVFAPSTSILNVGDNRFGFALFDSAQKMVEASAVAIYTSDKDGSDLAGPVPGAAGELRREVAVPQRPGRGRPRERGRVLRLRPCRSRRRATRC